MNGVWLRQHWYTIVIVYIMLAAAVAALAVVMAMHRSMVPPVPTLAEQTLEILSFGDIIIDPSHGKKKNYRHEKLSIGSETSQILKQRRGKKKSINRARNSKHGPYQVGISENISAKSISGLAADEMTAVFSGTKEVTAFEKNKTVAVSCHYETARGIWSKNDNICPFRDFIQIWKKNQARLRVPNQTLVILVGDSVDRNLLIYLSENVPITELPMPYDSMDNATQLNSPNINTAEFRIRHGQVFAGGSMAWSVFRIFGMLRPCSNGGYDRLVDDRWENRTADRIRHLLYMDILSRVPDAQKHIVVVGSNMWDISEGCNHQGSLSPSYAREYSQGIVEVHHAIREVLPHCSIYWRTAPPIKEKKLPQRGPGFTQENQAGLNQILLQVVKEQNLGVVVDWWEMIQRTPKKQLKGELRDGIHYGRKTSNAFTNLLMNVFFDHEPNMLLQT